MRHGYDRLIAETVLEEAIKADLMLAINAVRYAEEGQSAAVTRLLRELIHQAKKADPQHFSRLWLQRLPVGSEHVDLLKQLLPLGDSLAGEAVQLIAQVLGVQFKPELLDLLEAHADDFNFAVNGIARALGPVINESDLERLTSIAEMWLAKDDEHDSYSAIGDIMALFEPEALLRAAQTATGIVSPGMAALVASGLSERGDDESFALLADLLISYPKKTTSSFFLSIQRNQDQADATRYRCLDHRHIEAIWRARFSDSLWDSALSKVCSHRPDLKPYVEKMAETYDGVEAIALLYCSGTDNETLFASLERLLESSDGTLKHQPFEFFSLSNFDWRGRETFVQSLARDLPRLRQGLVKDLVDVSTMARGGVDLARMQPVIKLVEVKLESDDQWWVHY